MYGLAIYVLLIIIVLYFMFKKPKKEFHSHWNTFIPNFKYSTEEFYNNLIEELKAQEIPDITTRIVYINEKSIISNKRKYLRITWREFQHDVCCAPFGNGMFVSWWLAYKINRAAIAVSYIPFIGNYLARVMYPVTYYTIDTASMYMGCTHQAVLKVVDDITKTTGFRVEEASRKPILHDIFKR